MSDSFNRNYCMVCVAEIPENLCVCARCQREYVSRAMQALMAEVERLREVIDDTCGVLSGIIDGLSEKSLVSGNYTTRKAAMLFLSDHVKHLRAALAAKEGR